MPTLTAHEMLETKVLIEALTHYIDSQPDANEPDPSIIQKTDIAQAMLDRYKLAVSSWAEQWAEKVESSRV